MEDLRIKNFLKKSMYHERMIPYYMEVCDNDMFIAQYIVVTPFNNLRDIINDINFYHVDNVNFHNLYHKLYYLSISHPTIFNFVLKLI